jgi:hypothetical protein
MNFNIKIAAALMLALLYPVKATAQEREWQLDAQGEDAFLVFGVPNTTDMGISFWCKIGEKTMSLYAPLPHNLKSIGAKVALKIDSATFPLEPKFNTEKGATTVEALLKPQDEIFEALNETARIALLIANHKAVFPTEGANFRAFNSLCATAPVSN